jgi:hypothetical protein
MHTISMRPFQPTITGNVDSIEETKPLDVTCTTTGNRPRATLEWTIGQNALETATLTALHANICPVSLFPTLYVKSDITVYVSLAVI